ncbi:hypothetical protein ACMDCR_10260 [Labrys okinawensis]|uniref:hypothetical protein n=1 Tax=Labrys okinawensis TaxID=346911 RepID=UPI0039BD666B
MTMYFTFRWQPRTSRKSVLVVFSTADFEGSSFVLSLDEDYRENLRPDGIVVIVPETRASQYAKGVRNLVNGGSALRFEPARVPIAVGSFRSDGEIASVEDVNNHSGSFDADSFDDLKKAGLLEVFRTRDVLVRPGPALHFVHPNGDHSRGFLRAANALVQGTEVSFIAMALLPFLAKNPKRIWIDTSTIASIAYAMVSMRQSFGSYEVPIIESFHSYEGIAETKFEYPDSSLVLISATASGRLARKLTDMNRLRPAMVVNLFSSVRGATNLTVLCDVSDEALVWESDHSVMTLYPEISCPFCRDGSPLIRFVGDQFLANAITYRPHLVVVKDAPPDLSSTMKALAGRGLFKLKTDSTNSNVHRFWIDASKLIQAKDTDEKVAKAARRYIPASVSHIVHLNDPDSKAFADLLNQKISEYGRPSLRVIFARDAGNIDPNDIGSIVVASGCIGSGSALQSVSRDLRDIFKDQPRVYLGVVAKHAEVERHKSFRSDLIYNSHGYNHEFDFIYTLSLPRSSSLTAWMRERQVLEEFGSNESYNDLPPDQREYFEDRLTILSKDVIEGHQFFLPTTHGVELKLRDGFAFWPPMAPTANADQGDVLATIGSLLHHMRTTRHRDRPEPTISHTEFHCTVLSPGIFGRYNDGIIQSAFLRLAYPHELNFSARPDLSSEMRRLVERCLERHSDAQGEACAEFLMALATRRLTLHSSDVDKLKVADVGSTLPSRLKGLFEFAMSRAADS